MHYSSEVLSAAEYVLSFTISSNSTDTDYSKVLVALFDATKDTESSSYFPYQIIGSDGKYYQSKIEGVETSEKEVSFIINASKNYKVGGPSSTGNTTDTGASDATETNWNSGYKLCIALGGTTEGITYQIKNIKLTKQ